MRFSTLRHLAIVVVGDPPGEIQSFLDRRRRLGLDGRDEVWAGVLHVVPNPHARHAKVSMELIHRRSRRRPHP